MSQFSDWERDYGSPYDRGARKRSAAAVPLIDVIEMAGQQLEALTDGAPSWTDIEPYARLVMEHSGGGLTLIGIAVPLPPMTGRCGSGLTSVRSSTR